MSLLLVLIGCVGVDRRPDQQWFETQLQAKGFRLAPCNAPPIPLALEHYPGWISTSCVDATPPVGDTHRFWFLRYSDADAPRDTLWRVARPGSSTSSDHLLVVSDHMDGELYAEFMHLEMAEHEATWRRASIPERLWSHWLH